MTWGLITGGFFWFFSLSSVLVGSWSDTFGIKRVLSLLGTIWALVQFATIFAVTFPFLLITRVVLGADEGGRVWVSTSEITYLQTRYAIPPALINNIASVNVLIEQALTR